MHPAAGPKAEFAIRETPKHSAGAKRLVDALAELREHPNGNCQSLNDEFLSCGGKVNNVPMVFVMAKDKSLIQADGAPLGLRCRITPGFVCIIEEELDGGITIAATLPGDLEFMRGMTAEKIKTYQEQMQDIVDGLRDREPSAP
jgi:hypothetical protein